MEKSALDNYTSGRFGTAAIAINNYFQLGIMKDTLSVFKAEFKISKMPLIRLCLNPDFEKGPVVNYGSTSEEGGERWTMYYFIKNIGDNPAYNLRYYHEITTQAEINDPDSSKIQYFHQKKIIWPGDSYICGSDQYLRQAAIDLFGKNDTLFRHFYVVYEDELGNKYKYKAKWALADYKKGEPPGFLTIEYKKIPDWPI